MHKELDEKNKPETKGELRINGSLNLANAPFKAMIYNVKTLNIHSGQLRPGGRLQPLQCSVSANYHYTTAWKGNNNEHSRRQRVSVSIHSTLSRHGYQGSTRRKKLQIHNRATLHPCSTSTVTNQNSWKISNFSRKTLNPSYCGERNAPHLPSARNQQKRVSNDLYTNWTNMAGRKALAEPEYQASGKDT